MTADLSLGGPRPWLMRNPVRHYDWGSRSVLARLQGRAESVRPEAELWVGAHPSAPSELLDADGRPLSLAEVLAADPVGVLGRACVEAFGPRLPFLLKVLAVDRALSVQVHPAAELAAEGFAAGVAGLADPYGKAEMVYAVSSFDALAGLRPAREAGYLVDLLDVPRLQLVRARLGATDDVVGALAALASWPAGDRRSFVADVDEGAGAVLRSSRAGADPALAAAMTWVQRLVEQFPADPLVVAPLLLRLHRLTPGGTLFVPTGVPHSYLRGTAVEIMVGSDNVTRAGLTGKPVAVEQLVGFTDPAAEPVVALPGITAVTGERVVVPPVEEFLLTRTELDGGRPVRLTPLGDVPQVVLCLRGAVDVVTGEHRVRLGGGSSAFLAAGCPPVVVDGEGEVFRAAPAPAR